MDQELTLQDKLKSETRACPRCTLAIENPFIERCPRCFEILSKLNVECDGCVHRILCPIGKSRKFTHH